jgi:drug/metabolite transporter (DMT)-like permease
LKKWIAFCALFTIYGAGFMFVDIAVDQITPLELNVFRFGLGAVMLLILLQVLGIHLPLDKASIRDMTVIGVGNNALPFTLIAWAQTQGVDSGLSGVLVAANPLFSLIVAHFLFVDERMTPLKTFGVIVGFVGVIILISGNIENGKVETDTLVGEGAIILSALMFAFAGSYSRKVMQGRNSNPIIIGAGTTVAAALFSIMMLAVSLLSGKTAASIDTFEGDTILAIAFLIINNSFIAVILFYYVIRELGVSRTSMIAYLIPIVSLFMGAVFLDEVIDVRIIIGTLVILVSLMIVNLLPALRRGRAPIVLDGRIAAIEPEL